jgi:glyoxylase-like metal-dependent hydrolase (beta-lactamase superfamily II)/rhodanese-related sulfurtransferase
MQIVQFVAESLGDSSYLVISGEVGAVVDPQRDVRPFVAAAHERGAEIRFVFETHVHNDYVSGGRELAALGAEVIAPAKANLQFPHRGVADGDEIAIGESRLRAVAAPGHTYEHTAYLAIDEAGFTKGAFTGGAVLIAGAGRSDLLGPDHTDELTRLQWESGKKIAALLTPVAEILPTHGAGSFCSASGTGLERRANLAVELERNPLFFSESYETFHAIHLAVAAPIPGYYRHMAPINRTGARVFGEPPRPALIAPAELGRLALDATIVDVRSRFDYAAGHIPKTIGIEESGSFLAYIGWLVPFNAPLGLISYDKAEAELATTDLFRIGYSEVRGYLPFADWLAEARATEELSVVTNEDAAEIMVAQQMPVLDVRFAYEHESEPLPGALARSIDTLPEWAPHLGSERTLVVCASGQRAVVAGSILQARGHDVVVLANGGATDLRALMGR